MEQNLGISEHKVNSTPSNLVKQGIRGLEGIDLIMTYFNYDRPQTTILKNKGFENLYNLTGNMNT